MDRDRTDPYGFGRRDERPRGDGGDGGRDLKRPRHYSRAGSDNGNSREREFPGVPGNSRPLDLAPRELLNYTRHGYDPRAPINDCYLF